ncbi:hypothetical protein LCGC14_2729020 [marine sediment metagenome]
MTKRELLNIIESFNDGAILIFSEQSSDLLDLSSDGHTVAHVVEVNTGIHRYLVLLEE